MPCEVTESQALRTRFLILILIVIFWIAWGSVAMLWLSLLAASGGYSLVALHGLYIFIFSVMHKSDIKQSLTNQVHPSRGKWQSFIVFNGWVESHCVYPRACITSDLFLKIYQQEEPSFGHCWGPREGWERLPCGPSREGSGDGWTPL